MAEDLMRNIQWFPGHMTKTRRMIAANLSLVDAVVEILDARIPQSSRNPEMDGMVGAKPRLLLLNKAYGRPGGNIPLDLRLPQTGLCGAGRRLP